MVLFLVLFREGVVGQRLAGHDALRLLYQSLVEAQEESLDDLCSWGWSTGLVR